MQNNTFKPTINTSFKSHSKKFSWDEAAHKQCSITDDSTHNISDSYVESFKKRKCENSPIPSCSSNSSGSELVKYQPLKLILYNQASSNAVIFDPNVKKVGIRRMVPTKTPIRNIEYYSSDLVTSTETFLCPTCHTEVKKNWFANSHNYTDSEFTMNKNYFRYLADTLKKSNSLELTYPANLLNDQNYNPFSIQIEDKQKRNHSQQSLQSLVSDSVNGEDPALYDSPIVSGLSQDSFNSGYYKRFFIEGQKLGRGLRGSVFLCQHVLDNVFLGEYAIKKVAVGNDHSWLIRMLKEVKLLESLNHPNIIEYKHSWIELDQPSAFGPPVPCLFILMEFANGGKNPSRKIPRLLIADFGECETMFGTKNRLRTGATGTMEFMAPELLKVDDKGKYLDEYSTKADMWSLGMLLYYLCYSRLPFNDIDNIDNLREDILELKVDFPNIHRGLKGTIDSDLKVLISILLDQNKNRRPEVSEILPRVMEKMLFYQNLSDEKNSYEPETLFSRYKSNKNHNGDSNNMIIPAKNINFDGNDHLESSIYEISCDQSNLIKSNAKAKNTKAFTNTENKFRVSINAKQNYDMTTNKQKDHEIHEIHERKRLLYTSTSLPSELPLRREGIVEKHVSDSNRLLESCQVIPQFEKPSPKLLLNKSINDSKLTSGHLINKSEFGIVDRALKTNTSECLSTLKELPQTTYIKEKKLLGTRKKFRHSKSTIINNFSDKYNIGKPSTVFKSKENTHTSNNKDFAKIDDEDQILNSRALKSINGIILFKYVIFIIKITSIININKTSMDIEILLLVLITFAAIDLRR
ncbi:hypothetical protein BB561_000049 [Smittium simulii]|uniref:non-specific serine/threonine protein kinase n=1 Tax=Smittium simulii TaxID=133385 RepID=A0A2T9Z0V8_9FUNG|nr:hypothetical protein BB561_000049 [Smittium simulii]